MKYDLAGNLEKDQGGLGGLHDSFAHVGCEPKGITPPPGRRERRGPLLHKLIKGNPQVQGRMLLLHLHFSELAHFTFVQSVQHWHTPLRLFTISGDPCLGRPQERRLAMVSFKYTGR